MLRKTIYPKIESHINKAAQFLNDKGISPNQLTLAGLALNFLAGWVYATGNFFLAFLVLLVAACGDSLDGPLARVSNRVTKFGAFLDSTIDRYSDFFLFGGVALYFAREDEGMLFIVTMGVIAGSFVTSYAKARAENFIPDCRVGLLNREERIVGLAIGSVFTFLLPIILWILLIGSNATAIHRILHTKKVLSEDSKESE